MARLGVSKKKKSPPATELSQLKKTASGQPHNKNHPCHCNHGISHELQPSGDVG